MLADVYQATGRGEDHPAMAPFDTATVERDLKEVFGDVNRNPDGPFLYGINHGGTGTSPWLSFSVNHSQVEAVTDRSVGTPSRIDGL
jgi:hypothetical protein